MQETVRTDSRLVDLRIDIPDGPNKLVQPVWLRLVSLVRPSNHFTIRATPSEYLQAVLPV
jgi:hypothetical protein